MNIRPLKLMLLSSIFISTTALAKDGEIESRGSLASLSTSSVTVGSLTCNVTSRTEFKDQNDLTILPSAFNVGDNVKLKCIGADAKELELETGDDNSDGGSDDGNNTDDNNNDNNKNKSKEIEINDKAQKISGIATSASGKAEYSYKRDGKGRTDIRFKSSVKIPVPSTIPLAATKTEAASLSLSLTISRSGTVLANCSYLFDTQPNNARPFVEFKIDLRNKRGELQTKKGICDTDLTVDGVQSGLPGIKKGDTYIITDSVSGNFLKGTF